MISIEKAKRILGKKYDGLNDDEVELLLKKTYQLAEVALNIRKEVFESPTGVIDSTRNKSNDKQR